MRRAGVVLAGTLTAVPANASASHSANTVQAAAAKVTWKKCATDQYPTLQCASVKVPLNYAKPSGKKITLALSRVPHTSKTYQGPLLVNPGGPGGSGLTLAGFVASSLPKKVAAQYDVIGFDPRGVGASKPALNCKPGYFNPVRPDSVPSTSAIEKANVSRAKAFAKSGHVQGRIRGQGDVHLPLKLPPRCLGAPADPGRFRLGRSARARCPHARPHWHTDRPRGQFSGALSFTGTLALGEVVELGGGSSASPSRTWALASCGIDRAGEFASEVVLVVSELMTNAVTHGRVPGTSGRQVGMSIEKAGNVYRVEVRERRATRCRTCARGAARTPGAKASYS